MLCTTISEAQLFNHVPVCFGKIHGTNTNCNCYLELADTERNFLNDGASTSRESSVPNQIGHGLLDIIDKKHIYPYREYKNFSSDVKIPTSIMLKNG